MHCLLPDMRLRAFGNQLLLVAGAATTVTYKKIVIAIDEGAKAELSAFDHLILGTPVETKEAA